MAGFSCRQPFPTLRNHKRKTMEIRQLRYFINAAKTLSFTEAATLSNVAQSTLSQQVKQLETELDVPLFHRMGKRIQLTVEGEAFLTHAQRVLDDAQQGLEQLADIRGLQTGSIRVGIAAGLGLSALLTEALTQFNKSYPKVEIRIHQLAAPTIVEMLRNRELDIALTITPSTETPDMALTPLFATRLCAIVAEHHSLASRQSVSLEQIGRHPLALPAPHLIIRRRLDKELKRHKLEWKAIVEMDNLSHLIYMVRNERWVSVLPDVAVQQVRGVVALPVDDAEMVLQGSVMMLANAYQRKAVTEFLHTLQQSTQKMLHLNSRRCDICGAKFMVE